MLTQSLLCKASNSTISVNRLFEKIDWTTYTYTWSIWANQAYTYITVPISSSSTYSISIQSISWKTNYSWLGCNFWIYIDNTRYDNYAYNLMEWYWPYTCNLSNLQWWNNLYFKLKNDYANQTLSNITVTHSDIIINETMNISKPSWDSVLYRDVVWLGKECWITILWYHIDWERIDHGNWWWLPVEFVEKIDLTVNNTTANVWTYDYATYVIAYSAYGKVSLHANLNWSLVPERNNSSLQPWGDMKIFPPNMWIIVGTTYGNNPISIYIYKLNLPS